MGVQTVIILVQSMTIIGLLTLSIAGWRRAWIWRETARLEKEVADLAAQRTADTEHLNRELIVTNDHLHAQLARIPLTPAPKKAENGPVQAKSAAQIRSMTERAWGKTPEGDEANGSV